MTIENANEARFSCRIAGHDMHVVEFNAREKISDLFEVNLNLALEEELNFDDVIGQTALITLEGQDEDRYFFGIVNVFMQTGVDGRFYLYQASVVPAAWLLSLNQDCKIFQKKTVPEIVQQIIEAAGISSEYFEFRLQGTYPAREYCVQYRQSDLDFISRLLEEEGIFYFFEHSDEKNVMVFGDGTVNYQPIPGETQVIYNVGGSMVAEEEAVIEFQLARKIKTGKYTLRDFNFLKPSLDLTSDKTDSDNTTHEVYDYPGKYADETGGRQRAQVRLEESVMYKDSGKGKSVCPRLTSGLTFSLNGNPIDAANQDYLLVEVIHAGAQPQVLGERSAAGKGTSYTNRFTVIPSAVVVRPEQKTPKPIVEGVQTAIVVGPQGEEIYTDKNGCIKVQFHWDRVGQKDENSSCWIRVSQVWAGEGWGAMFIPRIGHEVIVDFIAGDPDRPIITGRVYHGANTPPYDLPDEKTKSVIKSNTSSGGGGFNELRFEDKAGEEEIYLHGQKDWNIAIENDKTQNVGNDETMDVGNDRKKTVGNMQEETIGANKTIQVGADHSEEIGANQSITVGAHRTLTATSEEYSINGTRDVTVAGPETHTAGTSMEFDSPLETHTINGQRTLTAGVEGKTVNGVRTFTAAVENYTVSGARTITVGTETKNVTNQTTFLGMDLTTDSGAKFENFAGVKVSNNFALLAELKQIVMEVTNAKFGYTSFKCEQDGIEVKTAALHVIG